MEESKKEDFMSCLFLIKKSILSDLNERRKEKDTTNLFPHTNFAINCCQLCRFGGEVLICNMCGLLYHMQCLNPPLCDVPTSFWMCNNCKEHPGTEDIQILETFNSLLQEEELEIKRQKMVHEISKLQSEYQSVQNTLITYEEISKAQQQEKKQLLSNLASNQQIVSTLEKLLQILADKNT